VIPADGALADQARLIVEGTVIAVEPAPDGPATLHRVRVERLVKGVAPGPEVVVRVPGGRTPDGSHRLQIWGAPRLDEGARALLFLVEEGSAWQSLHLAAGTFHLTPHGFDLAATRDLSEVLALSPAGEPHAEVVRDAGRFARWLADRAAGVRRAADYLLPALRPASIHEEFTYLHGRKSRWPDFDRNETVLWRSHVNGQPGRPDGGVAAFQAAIRAWNDDPATNIRYQYAGTTTASGGFSNTILFEDPNGDIGGTYDCEVGGVLALAQVLSDPVADEILGADIVVNDGAGCFLTSDALAATLYGHELGHTLGLGHSCDDFFSGPCNSRLKREALMNPNIHRDQRGARLNGDDRAGIASLYGSSKLPPPTHLQATAVTATTVTLEWEDNSDEQVFLVQRLQGNKWKPAGRVKKNNTTFTVRGLRPDTTYAFRVVAKKGNFTSPSEALVVTTD
jgi:hypothetical protein